MSRPPILGTAQLGLNYGVANASGRPNAETALAIVREAWQGGVREFDTAADYGESEATLGRCLAALGLTDQAGIVSKLPPLLEDVSAETIRRSCLESLDRLGAPRLSGLMLHREEQLDLWDQGLGQALAALVAEGLVLRVGVSVYAPARALQALGLSGLSLVQIPANVFDRRFETAGVFQAAAKAGKTLHLRSVFLQGLLRLDPTAIPARLASAVPLVQRFKDISHDCGIGRGVLALAFVRERYPEARVLFGAESPAQVRQNLLDWQTPVPAEVLAAVAETFASVEECIVNPNLWPSLPR